MISSDIIDQMINAINASAQSIEVCTPSDDYYREPGDWTRETIHYIDYRDLISALELLK